MSRKVFTAGEVLAAADVNNFLMNQTVMSFSGTATRASSIGTPVEGMYTHLEDSDTLEYYNGSAWVNRVPQPGLTFIKAQAIGTAVNSIVISDVFSATYENYRVIVSGGSASATISVNLQIGAAATAYYGGSIRVTQASVSSAEGQSNATSYEIGRFASASNQPSLTLDILAPFLTTRTSFFATSVNGDTTAAGGARWNSGYLNNTTSYTSFTLSYTGTITGGTVYVYGYRTA
jgi:hypothetical protein